MKKHAFKIACISVLLVATGILLSASLPQVPSGTWVAVGAMNSARAGASTVLLQDGRILITGGNEASGPSSAAEFFGANGSFSLATPMNFQRSGRSLTSPATTTTRPARSATASPRPARQP